MKKINNNKGISYVEMIIVIAIIAILTTLGTVTISVVNNANLNKASSGLQQAIASARAQSMARGSDAGKLHVYAKTGGIYYTIGTSGEEQICNGVPKVFNVGSSSVSTHELSGAFNDFYIVFDSAGMINESLSTGCPQKIVFNKGRRFNYVYIYKLTGKTETGMYMN